MGGDWHTSCSADEVVFFLQKVFFFWFFLAFFHITFTHALPSHVHHYIPPSFTPSRACVRERDDGAEDDPYA